MINTPSLSALRKPVQSLQETCSSWFDGGRRRGADIPLPIDTQGTGAGEPGRYEATQWAPTHWAETSMEPRLP